MTAGSSTSLTQHTVPAGAAGGGAGGAISPRPPNSHVNANLGTGVAGVGGSGGASAGTFGYSFGHGGGLPSAMLLPSPSGSLFERSMGALISNLRSMVGSSDLMMPDNDPFLLPNMPLNQHATSSSTSNANASSGSNHTSVFTPNPLAASPRLSNFKPDFGFLSHPSIFPVGPVSPYPFSSPTRSVFGSSSSNVNSISQQQNHAQQQQNAKDPQGSDVLRNFFTSSSSSVISSSPIPVDDSAKPGNLETVADDAAAETSEDEPASGGLTKDVPTDRKDIVEGSKLKLPPMMQFTAVISTPQGQHRHSSGDSYDEKNKMEENSDEGAMMLEDGAISPNASTVTAENNIEDQKALFDEDVKVSGDNEDSESQEQQMTDTAMAVEEAGLALTNSVVGHPHSPSVLLTTAESSSALDMGTSPDTRVVTEPPQPSPFKSTRPGAANATFLSPIPPMRYSLQAASARANSYSAPFSPRISKLGELPLVSPTTAALNMFSFDAPQIPSPMLGSGFFSDANLDHSHSSEKAAVNRLNASTPSTAGGIIPTNSGSPVIPNLSEASATQTTSSAPSFAAASVFSAFLNSHATPTSAASVSTFQDLSAGPIDKDPAVDYILGSFLDSLNDLAPSTDFDISGLGVGDSSSVVGGGIDGVGSPVSAGGIQYSSDMLMLDFQDPGMAYPLAASSGNTAHSTPVLSDGVGRNFLGAGLKSMHGSSPLSNGYFGPQQMQQQQQGGRSMMGSTAFQQIRGPQSNLSNIGKLMSTYQPPTTINPAAFVRPASLSSTTATTAQSTASAPHFFSLPQQQQMLLSISSTANNMPANGGASHIPTLLPLPSRSGVPAGATQPPVIVPLKSRKRGSVSAASGSNPKFAKLRRGRVSISGPSEASHLVNGRTTDSPPEDHNRGGGIATPPTMHPASPPPSFPSSTPPPASSSKGGKPAGAKTSGGGINPAALQYKASSTTGASFILGPVGNFGCVAPDCSAIFASRALLDVHVKAMHNGSSSSSVVRSPSSSSSSLGMAAALIAPGIGGNGGSSTVTGSGKPKPFKCEKCPQTFSRSHDLKRHYYIHSQSKPYLCKRCGKGFARGDALKRHEKAVADGRKVHCAPLDDEGGGNGNGIGGINGGDFEDEDEDEDDEGGAMVLGDVGPEY